MNQELSQDQLRPRLLQAYSTYFNRGDIQVLCSELNIPEEEIIKPNSGVKDAARELIEYFLRHRDNLEHLIYVFKEKRPHVSFDFGDKLDRTNFADTPLPPNIMSTTDKLWKNAFKERIVSEALLIFLKRCGEDFDFPDDKDKQKVQSFLLNEPEIQNLLEEYHLVKGDYFTTAGTILFTPRNNTKVGIFAQHRQKEKRPFIINSLRDRGLPLIKVHDELNKYFGQLGIFGAKNSEFSEDSIVEALVNFLVHRDYTVDEPIAQIMLTDDYIAFVNPGYSLTANFLLELAWEQEMRIPPGQSRRRNIDLLNAFTAMGVAQREGAGIVRIKEAQKELLSETTDIRDINFIPFTNDQENNLFTFKVYRKPAKDHELETYKIYLKEHERELESLREFKHAIISEQSEKEGFLPQLSDLDLKIEAERTRLSEVKAKVRHKIKEAGMDDSLASSSDSLKQFDPNVMSEVLETIGQLEQLTDSLANEISSLSVFQENVFKERESSKTIIDELSQEREANKNELATLKQESNVDKARMARLAQELEDANKKLAQLSEDSATNEEGLIQLAQERDATKSRAIQLAQERDADKDKLVQLFQELEAANNKLAKLSQEREADKSRLAELSQEKETTNMNLAQILQEREADKSMLAQLSQELKAVNGKLTQISQEREADKNRLAQLSLEKETDKDRLAQLLLENTTYKDMLKELSVAKDATDNKIAELSTIEGQDKTTIEMLRNTITRHIQSENKWRRSSLVLLLITGLIFGLFTIFITYNVAPMTNLQINWEIAENGQPTCLPDQTWAVTLLIESQGGIPPIRYFWNSTEFAQAGLRSQPVARTFIQNNNEVLQGIVFLKSLDGQVATREIRIPAPICLP